MDERGQPGGTIPGENGDDAGPRNEPARLNGWAVGPWSNAGDALEPAPDPVVPPDRRPADNPSYRAWAPNAARYADLLAPPPTQPERYDPGLMDPPTSPVALRPPAGAAYLPASAPPYPYEGDIEDANRLAERDRRPIPTERPPPEVERDFFGDPPRHRADSAADSALSDGTPVSGFPTVTAEGWRDAIAARTSPNGEPAPFGPRPIRPAPVAPPPAVPASPTSPAPMPAAPRSAPPMPTAPRSAPPAQPTLAGPAVPPAPTAPPTLATPPAPLRPTLAGLQPPAAPPVAAPPVTASPITATPFAEPSSTDLPRSAPPPPPPVRFPFNNRPVAPPQVTPAQAAPPPPPPGYQPPSYRQSAQDRPVPRPLDDLSGLAAASYDRSGGYLDDPFPTSAPPATEPASADVLPQRVPSEPDVPTVPEPAAIEPPAEPPELARIATHLRRDDVPAEPHERPEGFDVGAVLAAVRGVRGVRDASLRRTPAGAHSLRLDLADGADPAMVSREVARLLQEKLGLAAAPQNELTQPLTAPAWAGPPTMPPQAVPPQAAAPPVAPPDGPSRVANPWSDPPPVTEAPRPGRRRAPSPARGRASVTSRLVDRPASVPAYGATARPVEQYEPEPPAPRPLRAGGRPGPRVVIDHVQVSTFGLDATVEVRLAAGSERSVGFASGPAVDAYVLRLCAVAASAAIDDLIAHAPRLDEPGLAAESGRRGQCYVEHAAVVPFGSCEVAVVVVLLVCGGWVEQLAGSALVAGDPRHAIVRATLAAVNRRLEALL